MRSDFIPSDMLDKVLQRLQPINRNIAELCLFTGFRVGDIVAIKKIDIQKALSNKCWLSLLESKTGKIRKFRLPKVYLDRLLWQSGGVYVFQHRTDVNKHRSRVTVWLDFKKNTSEFRKCGVVVSPHSLRKIYAVNQFAKCEDIDTVQRSLNHKYDSTTALYIMSKSRSKKNLKKVKLV